MLANLNEHPYIIRYYGSHVQTINRGKDLKLDDGKYLCITMEYCPMNLETKINNNDLNLSEVREYIRQLLDGISYIHENNYMHRDLKPRNILISQDNVIKISDFGLLRLVNDDTELSEGVGTGLYRAPEMSENNYNNKVDMYSIGIIIFELCYPEHDRKKFIYKIRNDTDSIDDNIEEKFINQFNVRDAIKNLLNHDPSERYEAKFLFEKFEKEIEVNSQLKHNNIQNNNIQNNNIQNNNIQNNNIQNNDNEYENELMNLIKENQGEMTVPMIRKGWNSTYRIEGVKQKDKKILNQTLKGLVQKKKLKVEKRGNYTFYSIL